MDQEEFDTALEKLWIHGGVQVTPDETVSRGHDKWNASYNRQRSHRLSQIEEISRFTNSASCRMLYLVRHFGDREDSGIECGICDFCSPDASTVSHSHGPNPRETDLIQDIIEALKSPGGMGTGKLYNAVCPGSSFTRSEFEGILRSLARAGMIGLTEQSFEKDDETIRYLKAELTHMGYDFGPKEMSGISIISHSHSTKSLKQKTFSPAKKDIKFIKRPAGGANENPELHAQLKKWRVSEAKRHGLPAFRIFSNRVLDNLSSELPTTHDELLRIEGVGPRFDEKNGNEIIKMVKEYLRRQK